MLASKKFAIMCVFSFLMVVFAATPVAYAQQAKWKAWIGDPPLQPGDKVRVKSFSSGWTDGTVVAPSEGRRVRVRFRDRRPGGEQTETFSHVDIRVPVDLEKTRRSVARGKSGKGENPFEVQGAFRQWSDSSGQFRIEAEVVEILGNEVCLKKRDGSEITVPIARLSQEDQEFLRKSQSTEPSPDTASRTGSDGRIVLDWSGAKQVALGADVRPNAPAPDGGPAAAPEMKRKVVLPPKLSREERVSGVFPALDGNGLTAVGVYGEAGGQAYSGIYLCNLSEKNGGVEKIGIPDQSITMDLGPRGDLLLTASSGDHGGTRMSHFGRGFSTGQAESGSPLTLWKIEDEKCVKQWACKPLDGEGDRFGSDKTQIKWAKFIDKEHVITRISKDDMFAGIAVKHSRSHVGESPGRLVLWELPDMRAVYTVPLPRKTRFSSFSPAPPVLSPGRKYLALLDDGYISVLDSKTGETVGTYDGAGESGRLLFRPDGKQIALVGPMRVQTWDFSTGEMLQDMGFSTPQPVLRPATWPAPGHILIGGRYLIDLKRGALLWEYRPSPGSGEIAKSMVITRRLWFLATKDAARALVPFTAPDKAVREAAAGIPTRDVLVFEPGMDVALDVRVGDSKEQENRIRGTFTAMLEKNGFHLDDSAPARVMVVMDRIPIKLKDESAAPGSATGDGGKKETFVHLNKIEIIIDNKAAWRVDTQMEMSKSERREWEAQTAWKRIPERLFEPDWEFFDRFVLPKRIRTACDAYTFGATELTPSGPKPAEPIRRK